MGLRPDGYAEPGQFPPLGLTNSLIAPGTHLVGIPNGSFEDGLAGWTQTNTGSGNSVVTIDTTSTVTGQNAALFTIAKAGDTLTLTSPMLPAGEGVGQYLAARLAQATAGPTFGLTVTYYKADKATVVGSPVNNPGGMTTAVPTKFGLRGVAAASPAGTRYMTISIMAGGSTGSFRVDEVTGERFTGAFDGITRRGAVGDGSTDNAPVLNGIGAGTHNIFDTPGTFAVTQAGLTTSGTIGVSGQRTLLGPGSKLLCPQGSGGLLFAKGTRYESFNEGADGDVRYWGHMLTGVRTVGVAAVNAGSSPNSFFFDVRGDDSTLSDPTTFKGGILNRYISNGGNGGIQAFYSALVFNTPTTSNNGNRNYVAATASTYSYAGDGGGSTGGPNNGPLYQGAWFGMNPAVFLSTNTTFGLNASAMEVNNFVPSYSSSTGGPSVQVMTGIQVVSSKGTRGQQVDIGIALGSQGQQGIYGPEAGWKVGFGISDVFSGGGAGGVVPLASDSTFIGGTFIYRSSQVPIATGIDLSWASISGKVLQTSKMSISDTALYLGSGQSQLSATSVVLGGVQVVGGQQAAINNSTLSDDNARAINALLAAARAHGLIHS